jgi:hypothetical protein
MWSVLPSAQQAQGLEAVPIRPSSDRRKLDFSESCRILAVHDVGQD